MKIIKLLMILVMSLSIFDFALAMEDQNNADAEGEAYSDSEMHQDKKQRGLNKIADDVDRCDLFEEADISRVKSLKSLCAQCILVTDWRSIPLQEDLTEYLTAVECINNYIQNLIDKSSKGLDDLSKIHLNGDRIEEEIKKFNYHNGQKIIKDHKLLLYKLVESGKADIRYIKILLDSFMILITGYGPEFKNNYLREIYTSEINVLLMMLISDKAMQKADVSIKKMLNKIALSAVIHIQEYLCFFLKDRNLFPNLDTFIDENDVMEKNEFGFLGKLLLYDVTAEGLKLLVKIIGNKNPLWKSIFEIIDGWDANVLHYCQVRQNGDHFNFKDIPEILAILINLAKENDADLDKLFNQWGFEGEVTPCINFLGNDYGEDSLEIYSQISDVFAAYGAKIDFTDGRYNKPNILRLISSELEHLLTEIDFSNLEDLREVEKYVNLTTNILEKMIPGIDDLADTIFRAPLNIGNELELNLAKPKDLKCLLQWIEDRKLKLMSVIEYFCL